MPIRSPEEPAHTVRELGLPSRAVTSLTRAGITDAAALAGLTRRELAAVPGLGAGMIAAIRAVVPEPPAVLPRGAAPGGVPDLAPDDDESPAAPAIPSFDSLRGPRRRSAVDLLLPDAPQTSPAAATAPPTPPSTVPSTVPPVRPPDYADLLRLGVHVARALAVAPLTVTRWSMGCLHRALGG
ncbi:DNA-directed RNA polymerase subunit alpha C-terminal domain-containing protein [Blastococcus capsensis]|uniref:DNA-directed RNA polymerase subunit alpha C-terminal domain-containing protein n=1 Tax=Blastococcus capsensis TaxID=1564163 RepID=UPI0025410D73|nr:DNA-directed RNA polymerase subunit alpha C-terminal domain-containing protein [Blastococcus capsensis]MDK3256882.1 DNA-directed RNA polymerase subunit alpha C-terminal domain-containing protein [Blastococcus capsensis]